MKKCVDCKYLRGDRKCFAPQNRGPDYVGNDTDPVPKFYETAQYMRANEKFYGEPICGPDAAWFVPIMPQPPEAAAAGTEVGQC